MQTNSRRWIDLHSQLDLNLPNAKRRQPNRLHESCNLSGWVFLPGDAWGLYWTKSTATSIWRKQALPKHQQHWTLEHILPCNLKRFLPFACHANHIPSSSSAYMFSLKNISRQGKLCGNYAELCGIMRNYADRIICPPPLPPDFYLVAKCVSLNIFHTHHS